MCSWPGWYTITTVPEGVSGETVVWEALLRLEGNVVGAGFETIDAILRLEEFEAAEDAAAEAETDAEEFAGVGGTGGLRRTLETGVSSIRGVAMGGRAVGIIA